MKSTILHTSGSIETVESISDELDQFIAIYGLGIIKTSWQAPENSSCKGLSVGYGRFSVPKAVIDTYEQNIALKGR